jgi:hypothetical protein
MTGCALCSSAVYLFPFIYLFFSKSPRHREYLEEKRQQKERKRKSQKEVYQVIPFISEQAFQQVQDKIDFGIWKDN